MRKSSSKPIEDTMTLPPSFSPDDVYVDRNLNKEYSLPRVIATSDHTIARGIAGIPVHEIPLHKVLFQGIENWTLRYLASGKQTYYVMTKSYDTSTLLYSLAMEIKQESLQDAALGWNSSLAKPLPSDTQPDKRKIIMEFGKLLAKVAMKPGDHLEKDNPPDDNVLFQQLQEKEQEIASLKLQLLSTTPNPAPDSVPRRKTGKEIQPKQKAQSVLPFKAQGSKTDQPEEVEEAQQPELKSDSYKATSKLLQRSAPPSKKAKDVDAWGSRIIPKSSLKLVEKRVKDITRAFHEDFQPKEKLEQIRGCLIGWGLPISLATTYDFDTCSKILAFVTLAASKE